MSTVYLHMGMPKTGTTALQQFFYKNHEVLESKGFAYPIMPFHYEAIASVRNAHFMVKFRKHRKFPEWFKGFDEVAKAAGEYENIILSDEQLWSTQRKKGFWKRLKKGFEEIGVSFKVIVYLRRQDEQAESHWNQKVKEPKSRETLSFEEYLEAGKHRYMPFHYDEALDRIADRIGKENLFVRAYEKRQFKGGSIFADFLDILGLELTEEYELPEYTANVRLPNNAVEIKRHLNTLYPEGVPDFFYAAMSEAYGMHLQTSIPSEKTSMFTPQLRKDFMSQYEEGNAYVAREFLGRSDGQLFYDDYDLLRQWDPDDREMLLEVIRVLGAANVYLFERQEKLIRELRRLADSLPGRIYRKLRGAGRNSDSPE